MLYIFNCGQGDAFKISSEECYWREETPLYVDLGPSSYKRVIPEKNFDLMLTHCHDDHILGSLITIENKLRDLYLPAYFPEIIKIYKKLLGRSPSFPLPEGRTILVYDGFHKTGCRHINFINPPLDPLEIFGVEEIRVDLIERFEREYGVKIEEILDMPTELRNIDYPEGYQSSLFVKISIQIISELESELGIGEAIHRFFDRYSNKISIVFNYSYGYDFVLLMTGDADISSFNRIMNSNSSSYLKCNILKVPHHGSKHSIDANIINFISPDFAIFSHNNAKFGRAKDSHPDTSVLNAFSSANVKMLFTNDVVKNNQLFILNGNKCEKTINSPLTQNFCHFE